MNTEEIDHSDIITRDISKLFLNEICSDLTLIADGKRFVAHRIVLAARSDTFRQMLYNQTANAMSGKREIHIQNSGCSLTFKNFLKYLYTGKLSLAYMTQNEIEELMSLAFEYRVKQLVDSLLERQNIINLSGVPNNGNAQLKPGSYSEISALTYDGIYFTNLAKNAIVYEGLNKKTVFDSKKYLDESAYTQHVIDGGSYGTDSDPNGIGIMLSQPTAINVIKFRLWDKDPKRVFAYYVMVSVDKQNWTTVTDYRNYFCRSHQTLLFAEQTIQYIKIVGTHTNSQSFLKPTKYLTIKSFECGLSRQPFVLRDKQFWQPYASIATNWLGSVAIIRESDSNEYVANPKMFWANQSLNYYSLFNFGSDRNAELLVQLPQPIYASSISFVIRGDVGYRYAVSATERFADGFICEWSELFTDDQYKCGYQRVSFNARKILCVRINRIQCSDWKVKSIMLQKFRCPANSNQKC